MASVIDSISKVLGKKWNGFLATYDNIPPLFLKFAWNPEEFNDTWSAEYSTVKTPMGRSPVASFTGISDRVITFTLRFDSWNPESCWSAKSLVDTEQRKRGVKKVKSTSTPDGILGRSNVSRKALDVPLAVIELLKLPKSGVAQWALSFADAWSKFGFTGSKPSPPLTILGLSLDKIVMGFVRKADIRPLKFNKLMQITRAEVAFEFLVQESFLTTVEDTLRTLNGALSIQSLWK